ncbi:DUF2950 domain-containing protein [Pseudomonadota bacterium]
MKKLFNTNQLPVVSQLHTSARYLFWLLTVGMILCTASCSDSDEVSGVMNVDTALGQAVFAKPEEAANLLTQALRDNDQELINQLLGADYKEVLPLETVDEEDVDNYLIAWDKFHTLLPEGENKVLIAIGESEWTLPIPITKDSSGWYFDIDDGLERMRIRRIGRNELSTIQAVLAYYDAQMEYAQQDHNDDGFLEYAQKFISTPGTHDGLFWENEEGEEVSPLGPLMADHTPGSGYHGYFYKILKAQGESAKGGAYSYMLGDNMRAGFALIAWPEEYGESGVMSFIVSHSGIVYEQNLGPDGAEVAEAMTIYNPEEGWTPTKEVSGS